MSKSRLLIVVILINLTVYAHVSHHINYVLSLSPNYAEVGLVFVSSTQFGEAHLISTNYSDAVLMKKDKMYDEEIGKQVYKKLDGNIRKIEKTKAYLGSYYKFKINKGTAVEVYFYGTSVEYKCVTGNDLGITNIIVDCKIKGEFDLYSKSDVFDVTGFLDDNLKEGFHTLRIEATDRKNKHSNGTGLSFNVVDIKKLG